MVDPGIPAVRNLKKEWQERSRGRDIALIGWDRPENQLLVSGYRVLYSADWRPQKWQVLETEETYVKLSGLWPGRTYTVVVQATSPFGGWGVPSQITVTTEYSDACVIIDPPPGSEPCHESEAPWVISLGDSFISGEGGRWAGNTNFLPNLRSETDTGERAYYDYEEGESIEACHRSRAAMIHITVARSMNFACSGAITVSEYSCSSTLGIETCYWKPGVDRARPEDFPEVDLDEFGPAIGQAEMLARFAKGRDVKMVVLSIGGNNFHFGTIVTKCVVGYLFASKCSENEDLDAFLTQDWQDRVRGEVKTAIQEIVWAMRAAGHEDGTWTLVQTFYPKPIATGDKMRYTETKGANLEYRQDVGGCGFRNDDADWAVKTVLPTVNATIKQAAYDAKKYFEDRGGHVRLVQLDNSEAFRGHELCHREVKRVNSANPEDRGGVRHWRAKGASDKSEWMKEIELFQGSAVTKEEGFHPNYWGQLALRNCLRQVWNGGDIVSGGSCKPLRGKNRYGEPNMEFVRVATYTHLDRVRSDDGATSTREG